VEKAPYYAIKFYPVTMGTFGGVKTNDSFQVLKEDGSIIENLYATGENANKILYNQVYMSGSAVQFALTSGRIAGQHAAENLK
jgi:fumarate reductase flavoprotein subunit